MLSRRRFLGTGSAALAAATLSPRPARASGGDRKFIFVVATGGWDPTRVFATTFDRPLISMEPAAQLGQVGNLAFVDHAERPQVRAFFERYHSSTLIVNGLSVPSLSHSECLSLGMTGVSGARAPDWPVIIAARSTTSYGLPHVVIRGPQFPGTLGGFVTRVGRGHIEPVLTGAILAESDAAVIGPSAAAKARMDQWIRTRAELRTAGARGLRKRELCERYDTALERSRTLESLVGQVAWDTDGAFEREVDLAIDLLGLGVSRCLTLQFLELEHWDSHADNDATQSGNFGYLFESLTYLMEQLEATPGTSAPTLADETVVVVMSDMGRTPQLNGGQGKDHWGASSAMLVGPGFTGDRVIGGFTEYYYGDTIDPASGELATTGQVLTGAVYGATLLKIADVDPVEFLDASAVDGVIV
ncbi:MAG: DUF1501 domain-containing protein [Pseudomonadota bacterium]|nr:DUF1501 domain-containing protein [Pseudomonadota bacterium]